MGSYRDSLAFRRSQRLRPDGTPAWPITDADVPSVMEREPGLVYPRSAMRAGARL